MEKELMIQFLIWFQNRVSLKFWSWLYANFSSKEKSHIFCLRSFHSMFDLVIKKLDAIPIICSFWQFSNLKNKKKFFGVHYRSLFSCALKYRKCTVQTYVYWKIEERYISESNQLQRLQRRYGSVYFISLLCHILLVWYLSLDDLIRAVCLL